MFRFYLNNTLVTDALNWFDFTETIERDVVLKALLPKYDVSLTFTGDAYTLIYTAGRTNSARSPPSGLCARARDPP